MVADLRVDLIGTGPAAAAVTAAIRDGSGDCTRIDLTDLTPETPTVVIGSSGTAVFDQVNDRTEYPWVAVELGGIGGLPIPEVTASITVLGSSPCYDCLRKRVLAVNDHPTNGATETAPADARLAGAIAGHLITTSPRTDWPVGRIVELPYTERTFYPVPHCTCGSPNTDPIIRDFPEVSLEEAVSRGETAVDDRVGLITTIGEAYSFPVPYYLTTLCDTSGFSDATASTHAAGVAADWNHAFIKAIGEALERYSAAIYRASDFLSTCPTAVDHVVHPEAFVLPQEYGTDQASESIPWIKGQHLETQTPACLPAEFVYFPPPQRAHKPPITTGLGLGSSPGMALASGLYEVIERDATMLAWYSTYEPLRLDIDDPAYTTLVNRARAEDLTVTPLLVTQDVDIPVITAAVARENGPWPRFAVGSSAHLDPREAARSALTEALQNWMELRGMGPEAADEEGNIGYYAAFPPEAAALVDVEQRLAIDTLVPTEPTTGTAAVSTLIDRITEVGLDAYGVRLTPIDVAAIGFEAVRVVLPEAQPLFTEEAFFGDRARAVPRELGFEPRLDRDIHPYP